MPSKTTDENEIFDRVVGDFGALTEEIDGAVNDLREELDKVRDQAAEFFKNLSVSHQIQKHPLEAVGVSAVLGALLGVFVNSGKTRGTVEVVSTQGPSTEGAQPQAMSPVVAAQSLRATYRPELQLLKRVAVGAMVRSLMKRLKIEMPQYESQLQLLEQLLILRFGA